MKVMLTHRPGGAYAFISDGWQNALNSSDINCERWDGTKEHYNRFKPDLYIGCSGHRQPIELIDRSITSVAIHVNPYSETNTGVNEPKNTIDWVINNKPNVVFGYGHDGVKALWSHWEVKHGIKWVPMPTGGDAVLYHKGNKAIDIGYLGGFWQYKGKVISKYLFPVIDSVNVKLHGWGNWPDYYGVTPLNDDQSVEFLASIKIAPCISEEHTHIYGIDIPERVFKTALSGAIPIHDTKRVCDLFPEVIASSSADNFKDLCINTKYTSELGDKYRRLVLDNHTYHHRLMRLFSDLHSVTGKDVFNNCINNLKADLERIKNV